MNQSPNTPAYNSDNPVLPPEQLLPTAEHPGIPSPPETSSDGLERQREKQIEQAPATGPPPAPAAITSPPQTVGAVNPVTAATPSAAADLDVIEQEWVNKIKQIIREHHDDPHAQEAAFEQVQIDYLKKRHGKDIKATRG